MKLLASQPQGNSWIVLQLIFTSLLICFSLAFSSCSTHFYKISGNNATLYLEKPSAKSVLFFSSLNGYAGQKLAQREGLWELTVPADKPFKYFYEVDGEVFLPSCPMKEKDDFGSENCIFEPES